MLIAGEETERRGEIKRFGRNRVSAEIPPLARVTRWSKNIAQKMLPFFLFAFSIFVGCRSNGPDTRKIVNFID